MLALVLAVLLVCLAAASVGALVGGFFWLTVLAFAGLLLLGAVALCLVPPAVEYDAASTRGRADIRLIRSASASSRPGGPAQGGSPSRAA